MVEYDHFLWFIVAAGSPYTGGYSNSSYGVAYIVSSFVVVEESLYHC